VTELAKRHAVAMPITGAIYDVLFNNVAPRDAIRGLMARPLKAE